MSKGFITGTNEELIKAYKESRDESYLKELIEANKGLINLLVSPYLTSIPNSELEDLTSESYIPMLRAIEDYDPEQGVAFSTLLKVYVRQHLNRLYNEATRQKRFTGTTPDSLDRLSEINKEGGTETDSTFALDVEELEDLINGLLQAGLVTSAEELEKALLQLLKKNILQSIELNWTREPEREQRLRELSR